MNLQNIPRKKEYRAAFTAQTSECKMICADYSGCELRILAELSQEPAWIDALKNNKDLHMMVYCDLHGLVYKDVVDENGKPLEKYKKARNAIKTLNFGLVYGMGPKRLADATGVSYNSAKSTMDQFFRTYPKIKNYLDKLETDAEINKYALSPLDGRKRWLWDFDWAVPKEASHARNIAKNLPFQGANASITKLALVNIREKILENNWDVDNQVMVVSTIHDEILMECKKELANIVLEMTKEQMLNAAHHYIKHVIMAVDATISDHWVK